jgi:EpsG family
MILDRNKFVSLSEDRNHRSWSAFFLVSLIIVCIRLTITPQEFADFNGYVYLLDEIIFNKWSLWEYGDPLSWGILSIFRYFSGDSSSAVIIGNIYLSATYLLFCFFSIKRYNISWHSVLLIFSVFGPILAFVTIRATPAYFLILFAALEASRGNIRALFLCLFAAMFHSSAILALPPLVASLAQTQFPLVDRAFRSKATAVVLGVLIVLPFVFFRDLMTEYARLALETLGGAFSRFSIYIKDGQNTPADGASGSIFQQIYFAISSIALLVFIFTGGKYVRGVQGYLVTSYAVFVFMSADPPSAFRQSLFWMMPLMVVFPWQKFAFRGLGSAALIPIAITLFWYGFSEVLI